MSKLDQNKTPLFTVLKDEYVRRNIVPTVHIFIYLSTYT